MQWFEQELELARKEGVINSGNLPFLFTPEQATDKAVILCHGFTSSPHEMLELGELLQQLGFTVYAPRLPGHGTTPEDLRQRTMEEWQEVCLRGYQALIDHGYRVSTAGQSTGAMLMLEMSLGCTIQKQVLLVPFLKLYHPLADFAAILRFVRPYHHKEMSTEEKPWFYSRRPVKAIAEVNRLRWQIADKLKDVTIPTLVMASKGDRTIAQGTSEELFNRLGSREKSFHLYGEEVSHVLTGESNPHRRDVLQRCCDFLAG